MAAVEPSDRQPRKKTGALVVDDDQLVRIMGELGLEQNGPPTAAKESI
jgi:hypothetical protein